MYVKPHTITDHAEEFTPKGLPLMVLVEANAPQKKGTPYIFSAKTKVFGETIEHSVVRYTNHPDAVLQELKSEWSNDSIKIQEVSHRKISHGQAAIFELVNGLKEKLF